MKNLLEHELRDDQLDAAAGGGTYTKDGFLKTTGTYHCQHFQCMHCNSCVKHKHYNGNMQIEYTVHCSYCRWHSTLKCSNPANMRT